MMNGNMRVCVIPLHRMQTIEPGDFLWLQVRIMKIPNNTALACYGVSLKFDPSILEFKEILFGDTLHGNQLDLHGQGTIQRPLIHKAADGSIGIVETSNLDMTSYIDSQHKHFTLASVKFQAKNEGISTIQLEWGTEGLLGPTEHEGMEHADLFGAAITVGSIPSVSVIPQREQIDKNDELLVQLYISGISPTTALACYGVIVKFNHDVLEFKETTFGDTYYRNQLDIHGQGTIQRPLNDKAAVGSIGIVETSTLSMMDYIDLQRKDFTLAVVRFQTKNEGISTIQLEWGTEQLEGPNVGEGMGPANLYGTTITVGGTAPNNLQAPQDFSVNLK